jgi:hypothetical protein
MGVAMFLPALEVGNGPILIGVLVASIALLIVLGGWASREPGNRLTKTLSSVVYCLAAVPISLAIVLVALFLLLPLMFAAAMAGGWPGPVGM